MGYLAIILEFTAVRGIILQAILYFILLAREL